MSRYSGPHATQELYKANNGSQLDSAVAEELKPAKTRRRCAGCPSPKGRLDPMNPFRTVIMSSSEP